MTNKYDRKINDIINKYNMDVTDSVDASEIESIIIKVFIERCARKKIAIWGVGKKNAVSSHCAVILDKYILMLNGMKCLIDSDIDLQGTLFKGFPIIAPDQIKDEKIDVIIIASRVSRLSIKESILRFAPQCEYIDIYEELEKRGIKISYDFFDGNNFYTELYDLRNEYENCKDENKKQESLKKLISYYLHIRDFYYAEKFIEIYAEQKYLNYKKYICMFNEIKEVCNEVKLKNSDRYDDVVIHLIDSLRAIDLYKNGKELNILKKYTGRAALFTEVYSTGTVTYESMIGTIKQKFPFEQNIYENNNFIFNLEDFECLSKIYNDKIMDIKFYTDVSYHVMNNHQGIKNTDLVHMTEKLWRVASDIACSPKKTFNFIYYPWELHFPMLCGYLTGKPQICNFADVGIVDMSSFIERQHRDCLDYVNKQFEFFDDLFPKNCTSVIMGDHSQPLYDSNGSEKPYFMYYKDKDRTSHIGFMVISPHIKAGIYKNLISMIDFNKILEEIIYNHCLFDKRRQIIKYQMYNVQNKRLREVAFEKKLMNYTEGIQCFLSKDYLYAKTATGKNEVYKLPDIENNISNDDKAKKFIKDVERQFDTSFPDFWTIRREV